MLAQPHSHESGALSPRALVRGIPARAQVRAAVTAHGTTPMSRYQCVACTWTWARTRPYPGHWGALQSGIELVLGHVSQPGSPPATGAVRLGNASDVDGSEGALSNPENHTFGLPVVGGAGSLLPRRAGVRALALECDPV